LIPVAFGGVKPELRVPFNVRFEPAELPDKIVQNIPMRDSAGYATCVRDKYSTDNASVIQVVSQLIAEPNLSKDARSPLLESPCACAEAFRDASKAQCELELWSDGLQHSRTLSFYRPGGNEMVRKIDVDEELQRLRAARLIAPLKGVRVVHGGMALEYRGDAASNAADGIRLFWEAYFREAGAQLVSMGFPVPLVPF
jgi:hypothetical protein